MAIKKSVIYNTVGAIGVVAVPAGITLGVVYGTTVADPHLEHPEATTTGAKFFDKEIADPASTYAQQAILNPSVQDNDSEHRDLSELTRLDQNMDSDAAHNLIELDSDGNPSEYLMKIDIDLQHGNMAEVKQKFLNANRDLALYEDQHPNENLGVYIGKDINERKIIVSLYKVKDINVDKPKNSLDVVEQFEADLGEIDTDSINFDGQKGFFEMFGSEFSMQPENVTNYLHLGKGSELAKSSPNGKMTQAEFAKAFTNKYFAEGNQGAESVQTGVHYNVKDNDDPTSQAFGHQYYKVFEKDQIFVTQESVVEWSQSRVKIIRRYYQLNKDNPNSYLDFTTRADKVNDPVGVRKVVTYLALGPSTTNADATKSFGNKEPIYKGFSGAGQLSPADEKTKMEADIKTPEFLTEYDAFRGALVQHSDKTKASYAQFLDKPIVQPGLKILGTLLPSIKARTQGMIDAVQALNPEGLDYSAVLTKEFVWKMFKLLSDSSLVNAPQWIENNIKEFTKGVTGGASFFWTDIAKLSDADVNNGGQYKLYSMFSGWGVIASKLEAQVAKAHPEAVLMQSSDLITNLFATFKAQGVLDKEMTISKLIGDPYKYISQILVKVADKGLTLSEDLIKDIIPVIPVSFVSENKDVIEKMLTKFLSNPNSIKELFKLVIGKDTPEQFFGTLFKDGSFSMDNLIKLIPTMTEARTIDASVIKELSQMIMDSGLLSDTVLSIIGPLIPNTDGAKESLEQLFANGAIKITAEEVTSVIQHGLQATDPDTSTRLIVLLDKFKEVYPALAGIDSKTAVPAALDFLAHGINLSDDSLKAIVEFVKAVMPDETLTKIPLDKFMPIVILLKDKPLSDLTEVEINSVLDVVAEYVPMVSKIEPYVYKLLHGGMTLDDLNKMVEVIKPGILSMDIPEVGKGSELIKSFYTGKTWLPGGIWHFINGQINSLLNKIIGHTHTLLTKGLFGMSADEISGLLAGVHSAVDSAKGTLDGFLGSIIGGFTDITSVKTIINSVEEKAASVWGDAKGTSLIIFNLLHNKILDLDGDAVNKIIEIINKVLDKKLPTTSGDALVELLNKITTTPLSSVNGAIEAINEFVKGWTGAGIPDSVMSILHTVLPKLLVGNDGIKTQAAQVVSEFNAIKGKVAEIKLAKGATVPAQYKTNPYTDLKTQFDKQADIINSGDPLVMAQALAKAKTIEAKIVKYNDAINAANTAWASLQKSRSDFMAKYKIAPVVATMENINATDHLHLDGAYDAIKDELEKLYKTDVSDESIKNISEMESRIKILEELILDVNKGITNLNSDPKFDPTAIIDSVVAAKITVKGLSPISTDDFNKFRKSFDTAEDKKIGWLHETWSKKAQILAAFLDKNANLIFGDSWTNPGFLNLYKSAGYKTFTEAVNDGWLAREIAKTESPMIYTANGFIKDVLQKTLSPENYAKVDAFIITPLGL